MNFMKSSRIILRLFDKKYSLSNQSRVIFCQTTQTKWLSSSSLVRYPRKTRSENRSSYVDNEDSTPEIHPTQFFDHPPIIGVSMFDYIRNWFFANIIIKPKYDADFSMASFHEGADQAIVNVSEELSEGNLIELADRVTPDALKQISKKYDVLSLKDKSSLRVYPSNIIMSYPYQLGIIIDEKAKKEKIFAEITMCYFLLIGAEPTEKKSNEHPFARLIGLYSSNPNKVYIANYRFIREITKGVSDGWTINLINQFSFTNLQKSGDM